MSPHLTYMAGSQIEGTTTSCMSSDLDNMAVNTDWLIINNEQEWRPNQQMLLLVHNDVHPGYVKLKSLDPPQPGFRCDNKGNLCYSSNDINQKSLKNMRTDIYFTQSKGPALTSISKTAESIDVVFTVRCSSWPLQAFEWLTRKRHYNWPPIKLLEKAEKEGCLLVSVGFSGSPNEDIEWRFSFSLLERELIWSWNETQRQCLSLLKLMLKNYIGEKVPEVLSSYHLKTLMFWMVEETPFHEWVPDNLTKHVMKALTKLLEWVKVGKCPSYFVRENNLFDGKLGFPTDIIVIDSIQELVGMGVESYLITQHQAEFLMEGYIMENLCTTSNASESPVNNAIIVQVNDRLCNTMLQIRTQILHQMRYVHVDTMCMVEKQKRCIEIGEHFLVNANNDDREFMQLLLRFIHSSLGSTLFAKAMKTQDGQTRDHLMSQALCELELGQHFDALSGKLKLATFHLMNHEYHKVLDIVGNALGACGPSTIIFNSIHAMTHTITGMARQDLSQLNLPLTKTLAKHYACDVFFLHTEERTMPKLLKFECLVPNEILTVNLGVAFLVADSMVYAHFLQCLCYFHTKQADTLLDALQKFHGYVKQDYKRIPLKPSALNLLAHCCFMAGKYHSGLKMLRKSIKVCPDPRHNGALWILGDLVHDDCVKRTYNQW